MKLTEYLADAARRRAFREAMGMASPQPQGGGGGGAGVQGTQPQAGIGSQRGANQQGGMAQQSWLPPVQPQAAGSSGQQPADGRGGGLNWGTLATGLVGFATGGPIGAGAAILGNLAGGGGGGQARQQQSGPSSTASRTSAYNTAQESALRGGGAIDPSILQGAFSQGLAAVNAQAQQGNEALQAQLASRGVLHSGILGSGLADIERGRLSGVAGLSQNLAQTALNYQTQAQEAAMGREAGMIQQQVGINAAEPEWWETLAGAAVPISQYLAQRNQQPTDYAALAAALGLNPPQPVAAPTPTRGYDRLTKEG